MEQPGRKRPAYGAGKSAPQGERHDGGAGFCSKGAAKRRERRVVEPAAHTEPKRKPSRPVNGEVVCTSQQGKSKAQQQRADSENRPAAVRFDRAPDGGRGETAGQEPERQAANHNGQRPTGVGGNRRTQYGEQVVGRTACQNLRNSKRRDHDAPDRTGYGTRARSGAHLSSATATSAGARTYLELQNSQVTEITPSWIMWSRSSLEKLFSMLVTLSREHEHFASTSDDLNTRTPCSWKSRYNNRSLDRSGSINSTSLTVATRV